MIVLYTSFTGCYAFDENFKPIEHVPFKDLDSMRTLERNEWLKEEKELLKKHEREKIFFLGFKKEKIEGVVLTQDISKLEKACKQTDLKALHNLSLKITKEKLKKSVQKDWLIIQASNSIEDLNKTSNLIAKRLREWYELYNPEFSKSIEDHEKFTELIITYTRGDLLKSIGIIEKDSMGSDLEAEDLKNIMALAQELTNIYALREQQKKYIEAEMQSLCPNLKEVAGPLIGAKLITLAGSLKRLSEMPASTIQVLGAEKALFRHIRTGAKSPKYGIIFNHPLIQKGDRKLWGKISRALADKIAIAAKVDYFKGKYIGDRLIKELETRFA